MNKTKYIFFVMVGMFLITNVSFALPPATQNPGNSVDIPHIDSSILLMKIMNVILILIPIVVFIFIIFKYKAKTRLYLILSFSVLLIIYDFLFLGNLWRVVKFVVIQDNIPDKLYSSALEKVQEKCGNDLGFLGVVVNNENIKYNFTSGNCGIGDGIKRTEIKYKDGKQVGDINNIYLGTDDRLVINVSDWKISAGVARQIALSNGGRLMELNSGLKSNSLQLRNTKQYGLTWHVFFNSSKGCYLIIQVNAVNGNITDKINVCPIQ